MKTPAEIVIEKCGGHKEVARITGRSLATVYKWTYPPERSGTGGEVPLGAAKSLLAAARRGEVDISPADFFGDA